MSSSTTRSTALSSVLLVATLLTPGCGDAPTEFSASPDPAPANESRAGAQGQQDRDVQRQLVALRRATAAFHDFAKGQEAGYTVLVTHPTSGAACLEDPADGGMGRHYLNPALVDDQVSVSEPEVVIYEPVPGGELHLVGLEYIIPYTIRGPEETPPTLFGQEFLHNPTFQLWMLHVYLWKHNPEGIFATWNPMIGCDHDSAVEG